MNKTYQIILCIALAILLVPAVTAHAQQPDKVSLGLAVAKTFEFYPAYLGDELGVWKKRNLDVSISTFRGDAAMQQAILAGSVQIGLSSGAASAGFIAKGQPIKIVSSIGSKLNLMVIVVRPDAGIQRRDDLKGKTIGFTTHGALTDWLVRAMSLHMGWGVDGIKGIPLGGFTEQVAAMKRKQSDGFVWSYEGGMELEEKGEGKVLLSFGEIIKDFEFEVIVVRNDLMASKPDAVKRFLEGWYETVRWMKKNKEATIKDVAKKLTISENVARKTYEFDIENLSNDGTLNMKGLEVISQAAVDLKIVPQAPKIADIIDTRFLPVRVP